MNARILIIILVSAFIFGCATKKDNKSIYQYLQNTNKSDCNSLVVKSQYDECMARSTESFEDYDRKRSEIVK